jgi:carbon storage regulator CsrA
MLILSRKLAEKIVFTVPADLPAGSRVEMQIVDIGKSRVRVGIDAPAEVLIVRGELEGTPP